MTTIKEMTEMKKTMKTKNVELLEEYSSDEFHIYGLWLIELENLDLVEMAAAIGVRAQNQGTAKTAATWNSLTDVWFNDQCDWSGQGGGQELSIEQRDEALEILRENLEELFQQYDN